MSVYPLQLLQRYFSYYMCYILVQAGHSKVVSDWENEKENVSRLEEEVEHLRTELQQREVCVCGFIYSSK